MPPLSDSPVLAAPHDQPSVEERRALIERVAACDQFSRSARLRDFLLYVGRQSLMEGCPEIHEEEIGVRVFGRPASYDRGQDNIVRVNATELRKRVEAYFAGPGAEEPLVFEIPRGAYKPVFHWRPEQAAQAAQAEHTVKPPRHLPEPVARPLAKAPAAARGPFPVERAAWIVLSLCLAGALAWSLLENRSAGQTQAWRNQPSVAAFWSGFLDPRRQTDLVLPDDSASVIEDIAGSPISLNDYMSRGFMRQIQSSNMSADRKQDLNQIFNHNLVTFGAVRASQVVQSQIPSAYPRYLTLARNFSADELNRSNVVFIGGAKAMPWDHLFDDLLNFSTDYDYKNSVAIVRNRNPKPGEQPVYTVSTSAISASPNSASSNSIMGYAVIAYLPSPSRNGHALILAGTDSDAIGAAAAFLSSEERMSKLRSLLHAESFPYFEVLLKTSRLSGTFFDAEPVAWRTYPNLR
jgi:hypothetical protein